MKNIVFFSSSRADYGIVENFLNKLDKIKKYNLTILVSGSHLSRNFGYTAQHISKDFKKKFCKIKLPNEDRLSLNFSFTDSFKKYSKILSRNRIDLLILLGDRYETFSIAIAAKFLNIKILHLHGGEKTLGSLDNNFRYCISNFSNYHAVSHHKYKDNLVRNGINEKNIINIGSLSLEDINKIKLIKKEKILNELDLRENQKDYIILMVYHPNSLANNSIENIKDIKKILISLAAINNSVTIIYSSNFDVGGKYMNYFYKQFVKKNKNFRFVNSKGRVNYLSLLKNSDLVIGNSSSGIIETASFKKITINLGSRQKGRIQPKNILNCEINSTKITNLIKRIKKGKSKPMFKDIKNPYEAKNSSSKLIKFIKKIVK